MSSLPISFVIASRRRADADPLRETLYRLGVDDVVVAEGHTSMAAAYDAGARQARHDVLCFLHDDVELAGLDAADVLARLAEPRTGFLGVAGTRLLDASGVWWSGVDDPRERWRLSGRCGHRDGERRWLTDYGPFGEVVVLDGVLLFTRREVWNAIGGFGDPPLGGFDFYDLSATLRAHLAGFVNHTVPVDLVHRSLGAMRPGFDDARRTFLARYGDRLPVAVAGARRSDEPSSAAAIAPGASATASGAATQPGTPTVATARDANATPHIGSRRAGHAAAADLVARAPRFEVFASPGFASWLAEQRVSLAFTTYQAHKLFLLGAGDDGRVAVCERTFERSMGLCGDDQTLWLASLYQLWRLENVLPSGQRDAEGADRLYVPQLAYTTGALDVHDLAVDHDGRVVFVNTLFSCLATPSARHSFDPLWQPPFVSALAPEDRCHLNGLAMRDGRPAYVTCLAESDEREGWRERRLDGGVVLDVASGESVARGLAMPHSPRWHRGRLWVLRSGTGQLGWVDLASGRFEPLVFLPGYLRGLALSGDFAVVGASRARRDRAFADLPLDDELRRRGEEPSCGLHVVDLERGEPLHTLRLEGVVEELYDVVVLPAVRRPRAVGVIDEEIRRTISYGPRGVL